MDCLKLDFRSHLCVWIGRAIAMDDCEFYKIFFYIVAGIVIAVSSLVSIWCCLYDSMNV